MDLAWWWVVLWSLQAVVVDGAVEVWDMGGGSTLPPMSYLESFSEPKILRGACLRRGGDCGGGGTVLSVEEVAGFPVLEGVLHASSGPLYFVYSDPDKPLASVRDLWDRRASYGVRNATGAELLGSEAFAEAFYSSSPRTSAATTYLNRSVRLEALWGSGGGGSANVWLGRHSTASAHYDASTNVFAVVHGSKIFDVARPGAVRDEASYMHPHFRRSSSLSNATAAAAAPAAAAAAAPPPRFFERVVLVEGDVLVLPAYWWHHVSTGPGALSVSTNSWSRSGSEKGASRVSPSQLESGS